MGMDFLLQFFGLIALIIFIILAIVAVFAIFAMIKILRDGIVKFENLSKDFQEIKLKADEFFNELSGMRKTVEIALTDFSELNIRAKKSLDEMTTVMNSLDGALGDIQKTSAAIRVSAENFDDKVDGVYDVVRPFRNLSEYAYSRISPSIINTVTFVSALSKGINAFAQILSKKKHR